MVSIWDWAWRAWDPGTGNSIASAMAKAAAAAKRALTAMALSIRSVWRHNDAFRLNDTETLSFRMKVSTKFV